MEERGRGWVLEERRIQGRGQAKWGLAGRHLRSCWRHPTLIWNLMENVMSSEIGDGAFLSQMCGPEPESPLAAH